MASRPKKLLGQVRDALRLKHYSIRTETTTFSILPLILLPNTGYRVERMLMGRSCLQAKYASDHPRAVCRPRCVVTGRW